ncbi:hypothetical protein Rhopal_003108-T1 [Rhodotorula paludigena]|uniref:DNA polymerase kappa n=1 Tax=Rhodotorula paludigena TaxID=86838 RepID=A0AAV5GLH5_9BASI|nr:hypothetical protein Rhopal_003108-T1 [Rhodotorula paludigena]
MDANAVAGPSRPEDNPSAAAATDGNAVAGPSAPRDSMLRRMGGPSDLKAGVGGFRTPEEVQQIVYDASKEDQERRDRQLQVKVDHLKARLAQEEHTARGDEEERADTILRELEDKRDLSRVIALIDADAFYANCHVREDPSLQGKAFGVGGGMLTTASYEARKYGCRSAMPLFIAKKLCPHIISLKLEPELYVKASKEIMTILAKYGPIAPASLDEAYVDLTQYCQDQGVTPTEAITRLRNEVKETTSLTVSAGVSPNKALSKIAADMNKPDGQFVVDNTAEACMTFIKGVRLRKCYGIGRVCETLLNGLGLEKVGDIYRDRRKLYLVRHHLGQSGQFRWLLSLYLGMGSNGVVKAKRGDRKTYGVEKTFHPTDNQDHLEDIIRRVAKSLAKDLDRAEFSGRTITLKIKHDNYQAVTRAHTPGKGMWFREYKDILRFGLDLFHKEQKDRREALEKGQDVKGGRNPVIKARLLGLRVGNLRDDREAAKTSKLDGYFKPTASSKKVDEISLISDSDSDVEREHDAWGDAFDDAVDDDEEDAGKRELKKLLKDAEYDPFAPAAPAADDLDDDDGFDDEHGGASGSGSGRWQCPTEDDIIAEGKPTDPPVRPSLLSATRSSTSSASSSSGIAPKRKSPSVEPGASSSSSSTLGKEQAVKKVKKQKQQREEEVKAPVGVSEFICPVCQKSLVGSEAAMSGHVAAHFDASSSKKTPTSTGFGAVKKGRKARD